MENKRPSLGMFGLGLAVGAVAGILAGRRAASDAPPQIKALKIWQETLAVRRGEDEAAELATRVGARYAELYAGRQRLSHRALRHHLEDSILPGLALYQVLQEVDGDPAAALDETEELLTAAWGGMRDRSFAILGRMPDPFNAMRRLLPLTMRSFPAAGWQTEQVEDNENRVAFNMHSCFYLETLTTYGAPELTGLYCNLDDRMFESLPPSISWDRTKTLARGGDCCDFRWSRVE